jgi:predicted GNAT family acetyltransferase
MMVEDVELKLNERRHGGFYITDKNDGQLGEMVIGISGTNLTVYHTEVSNKAENKGLAKKMFMAMVDYARKNSLKVVPLCSYVLAQFQRHPEDYADIWYKE